MINFNKPPYVGGELDNIKQAVENLKICGDGPFTKKCNAWLEKRFHAQKVLLTTSGTTALDMAMLLCDLKPGDEVILPSYTFKYSDFCCFGWCEACVCGYSPGYHEYR